MYKQDAVCLSGLEANCGFNMHLTSCKCDMETQPKTVKSQCSTIFYLTPFCLSVDSVTLISLTTTLILTQTVFSVLAITFR